MTRVILIVVLTSIGYCGQRAQTTYQDAGVHIEEGNRFVDAIKQMIRSTARPGASAEIGGFGGVFDLAQLRYHDPLLIGTADGVGTKLKLAQQVGIHHTIGIDLVAMNVNDLLAQGAEPLFFLDYIATGALDLKVAKEIMTGVVQGCRQSNCALIGGETAEMPGMYKSDEYDLAGFAVGIVEREHILPNISTIQPGDIIIGLRSSGLHSNGFSLVRYLLEKHQINLHDRPPFACNHTYLYQALLEPTAIYTMALLPLLKQGLVKSAAHITGGGFFDNIPRVLPEHLMAVINKTSWQPDTVFDWLQNIGGISDYEMFRTFNMGIGMILIVSPEQSATIISSLKAANTMTYTIGVIATKMGSEQVLIE